MSSRRGALLIAAVVAVVTSVIVLGGSLQRASEETAITGPRAKPRSERVDPDATFRTPVTPAGIDAVAVPSSVSAPAARFVVPRTAEEAGYRPEGPPEPGATVPAVPRGQEGPQTTAPVAAPQEPEPQADHREAPLLSPTFDSTDFDTNSANTGGFVFIPPDPHGAAGPDDLINVTNVTIRFHDKSGTLNRDEALSDFFASVSPATFTFDPKVLYDQFADRFVVVTLELVDDGVCAAPADCTSRILVAVSDDSDPSGTWHFTDFDSEMTIPGGTGTQHWADYPGFAVDEEAVYITTNMFEFAVDGTSFGGVRLWVIDKGLAGGFYDGAAAAVNVFNPYAGGGSEVTTQPAHVFGTAPGSVGTFLVSHSGLTNMVTETEAVQVVRMDDPLGSPTFTQAFIDVGDIDDVAAVLPDAPQDGTSTLIEVNDRRALDADWRDDSLWMTATILPNSGPDSGETTATWWEIDTSTLASLAIADQGLIGGEEIAPGAYTFFPGIAVNNAHHVGIGYAVSAPSIFPSSAYTTRSRQDPPGEVRVSRILRAGTDHYERTFGGPQNRWGDYTGVTVDPSDDCFWIYNQHAIDRGNVINTEDGRWGTAWGRTCSGDLDFFIGGLEPADGPRPLTLLSGPVELLSRWDTLLRALTIQEREGPAGR